MTIAVDLGRKATKQTNKQTATMKKTVHSKTARFYERDLLFATDNLCKRIGPDQARQNVKIEEKIAIAKTHAKITR